MSSIEHDMAAILQIACDADEAPAKELLHQIAMIASKHPWPQTPHSELPQGPTLSGIQDTSDTVAGTGSALPKPAYSALESENAKLRAALIQCRNASDDTARQLERELAEEKCTFEHLYSALQRDRQLYAEMPWPTALREATAIGIANLFAYCGAYESLTQHQRLQWDRLSELAKLSDQPSASILTVDVIVKERMASMEKLFSGNTALRK